jgi:hypothetical protein
MAVTQKTQAGPLRVLWAALFFSGLACVLLSARALVGYETVSTVVSGVGLALALAGTVLRLLQSGAPGPRGEIGRLLGFAQLAGVVGLLVYWASALWLVAPTPGAENEVGAAQVITIVWVTLIAVSVTAVAFGEWAIHNMRTSAHVESSRVRFAVQSGAALALAAAYGSLFVYAAAQQEAKADYSYFKTSKPGEPTLKLVDQLGDKVTITAFFPEVNEVRREVASYLAELTKRNPALQVRLVDRYLEPRLASDLNVTRDGVLVLARDGNKQTVTIGTELNKVRGTLRKLDEEVHGKLMKLLRDKKVGYLTTGHGELNDKSTKVEGRSAEVFRQVVEQGNLRLQDLGLAEGLARDVPEDADVLIVLGPSVPFAPEELAAIRRYVQRGGKLLLALDSDVPVEQVAGPGSDRRWLAELAGIVGVTFTPTTLADVEHYVVRHGNVSDRMILPTNRFSSHASVTTLSRNPARGVVVLGASYLSKDSSSDAKAEVAMRSMTSTFEDKNSNFERDEGEDFQEYTLAMAVTRSVEAAPTGPLREEEGGKGDAADKNSNEMRAFVVADADALSDLLMPRVPGNPLLAFDAIRWLVGEESLAGQIESEEDVRVEQTKQMNMAWFYATVFGVPVGVLLLGVLVSRRGRSQKAVTTGASA